MGRVIDKSHVFGAMILHNGLRRAGRVNWFTDPAVRRLMDWKTQGCSVRGKALEGSLDIYLREVDHDYIGD